MRNFIKFWIAVMLLVLGAVLASCGDGTTETGNPTDTGEDDTGDGASIVSEEQACVDQGGEFLEFGDGCADKCSADDVCTDVITESCDCGDGLCWNTDTYECE